jgi:hypothetical protein
MEAFRKDVDHYPHHYVMHVVHAAQVLGCYHPEPVRARVWAKFYEDLCKGLHVNPESRAQLERRLNADEVSFGNQQTA